MKKIKKKLRSQTGESIAETLIAVLVIAVALTMLASMISATVSMVKTSEAKMEDYYKSNAALETLSAGTEMYVSISANNPESGSPDLIESVKTVYAINEVLSEPVIAYRYNG